MSKTKKILALLILVLGAGWIIYYLIKNYYHIDEKAIVNLVKPPSEDIRRELPQGSDVSFPLTIPEGFRIAVFADLKSVGAPRVLTFDPNGVLLVSLPSEGKVVALPDKDANGKADEIVEVATNLDEPHGIDFANGKVYIAQTDKVVGYDYDTASLTANNSQTLFGLPGGGRHFTRTIKVHDDKLYTSVGSSCDVCEEQDAKRAAILVSDLEGKNLHIFARGLRNTVFFIFDNEARIWGNDMGRDFLGDNLPPDELNIIEEGNAYGWPFCYGNRVRDIKFEEGKNKDYCTGTEPMVFGYPAHNAPLGLTFINSPLFAKEDQGDLLAALHGSWNSSTPVGYKIVKLNVEGDRILGMQDFITGWLKGKEVIGRPVDLVFDKQGLLYVSDDKANLVYILTK